MNRRDQELLDRQLGKVTATPRHDGAIMLVIAAVFFGGIALGGFAFAPKKVPTQTSMNNANATMAFFLSGSPTTVR